MTPEKQSQLNSDFKRKMSSPESMFTPLKIPGSSKEDNYAKSKDQHIIIVVGSEIISSSCYCIPDFCQFTLSNM
jgi:hypothetical protein